MNAMNSARMSWTRGRLVLMLPILAVLVLPGCDLDAETFSAITPEDFFQTSDEFQAAVVPVYNQLGALANGQYWWNSQVSTDESIIPTRGQDWDDNGAWRRLHTHTWTPTDPAPANAWNDAYTGVARANAVLANLENTETTLEGADEFSAELRTLRAFFYYTLMDLFGNVPIVTDAVTDPNNPPANVPRADVFDFIEAELRESLPNLPEQRSASSSGRVTKGAARAILANMYLNAEVFRGEPMYEEAIEESDEIINSGVYDLAPDFFLNFAINNHTSPETIFAVEFVSQGGPDFSYHFKILHYNQFPQGCCNGLATLGGSYDTFDDDDVRKEMFLEGQAFHVFTGEPVNDRQNNPLIFSKDVPLTGASEGHGIRPMKWAADPNDPSGGFQNDYAFFRLAEIFMIKAEALFRLGREGETLEWVNRVRERAFDPPQPVSMTDVSAEGGMEQFLLNERMREFHSEAKRRQDLIRFGRFTEGTWEHKDVSPSSHALFPIPQGQVDANPNLDQNPGY